MPAETPPAPGGFTCFPRTKGFTSTKVQMLTPAERRARRRCACVAVAGVYAEGGGERLVAGLLQLVPV
jgi:hypothetical protein